MIETISRSPIKASSSRRRQRTRSIGSSSTSYCDLPRTPIDAYDGRQAGPLGKDFALIKMDAGAVTLNEFRQDALKTTSNHQDTRPLPPWLSITLTGLDSKHPLRLLLPKSPQPPPPGLVDDSEGINVEDDPVFSFLPTDLSPDSVTSDGLAAGYVNMEKDELHLSNSSTSPVCFLVNTQQNSTRFLLSCKGLAVFNSWTGLSLVRVASAFLRDHAYIKPCAKRNYR